MSPSHTHTHTHTHKWNFNDDSEWLPSLPTSGESKNGLLYERGQLPWQYTVLYSNQEWKCKFNICRLAPSLPEGRGSDTYRQSDMKWCSQRGVLSLWWRVRSGWRRRLGPTDPFAPISVMLALVSLTWGYASERTGVTNWKKKKKKRG